MAKLFLILVFSILQSNLYSQNGWFSLNTGITLSIYSSFFLNTNTGYVCANDYISQYAIYKTTNGGNNWDLQISGEDYKLPFSVKFLNANTGFAVGGDVWLQEPAVLFKTTNGGINWTTIALPDTTVYRGMCFSSASTGYFVGSYGYIRKTSDGGSSWVLLNPQSGSSFRSVYFADDYTGYVGGSSGSAIKTTDGGITWSILTTGISESLMSMQFINVSTGYACGEQSSGGQSIIKTTNGGLNWTIQYHTNITNGTLRSIFFTNPLTGYACGGTGGSNLVLKTFNSGENWVQQEIPANNIILGSIYFPTNDTGFVGGIYGKMYKTFTGGEFSLPNPPTFLTAQAIDGRKINLHWSDNSGIETGFKIDRRIAPDTNWSLLTSLNANAIIFQDTGLIAGITYYYRVYSFNAFGNSQYSNIAFATAIISGIHQFGNEIPKENKLYYNYPNPFNPTTKIKFALPKSSFAKIVIYDALGRELETLVNEQLNAGTYEVDWNADKNSSGVYYYKLVVGDNTNNGGFNYVESKKMVLIK